MNFSPLFPSLMIFAHSFWRVSCDMELETLKKAIACDNVRIVEEFLNGENRERVLHDAIFYKGSPRWEDLPRREDSQCRVLGSGALHWAVKNEASKVTRLLLENGADVNMMNFQGLTPLSLLATKHFRSLDTLGEIRVNEEVLNTLFEFNPDVHIGMGLLPLSRAVEHRNILVAKKILAHGGNINERGGHGMRTPLHRAVVDGHMEMTKLLLDNGAEADATDIYGKNSLHMLFRTILKMRSFFCLKNQAAIARLFLRSEKVKNMLKQREYRYMKTPVDIFFKQPNREILVDLLKIIPSLDDVYAVSALRTFSPSLEQSSATWPLNNFPEYVKIAFDSYLEILSNENSRGIFNLNALADFFRRVPTSPVFYIKYFMTKDLYSLYVILQAHFQMRRGQDRKEEAAEEVKKFDEYLGQLSVPYQNVLANVIAKGTTFESFPIEILVKIFQLSEYGPSMTRMTKIISLVQFTRTQWSIEEMVDAAPETMKYITQKDILLL